MHFIKSILTFLLIPLMLVSTTGIKINQHWCVDQLINANIWGKAEVCSHFNEESSCPKHRDVAKKKNCCEERETLVKSNEDNLETSNFSISLVKSMLDFPLQMRESLQIAFSNLVHAQIRIKAPPLGGLAFYLTIHSLLI